MNRNPIFTAIIKLLLNLHSFLGKIIDVFSIWGNDGLHPKHHLMRYYEFFLDHIQSGSTILDIGCGNGFVSYQLAGKAGKVTGIDTEKSNIDRARRCHSHANIEYLLGDATRYLFQNRYDAIVLSNVLEHIQDRVAFLGKIKQLSDTILIRVPMLDRDWMPLYRKSLGMFYFCDSTHFTEYTVESFKKELDEADLVISEQTVRFGEIWAVIKRC
jgi:SAM-dependent methyltransferase